MSNTATQVLSEAVERVGVYRPRDIVLPSNAQTFTVQQLIQYAKENPPEPIVRGLLNKGDILLLHGSEESFKSIFVIQMAECIATQGTLLNVWNVPKARTVGVLETEMHEVMMGDRLSRVFPKGGPSNLLFLRESALRDWRRLGMREKCNFVQEWVKDCKIEVLIIDTVNDFFRGDDNPSEERHVGGFFDELRSLNNGCRIIVRHDRKRKPDQDDGLNSNERIRGSAEFKEDPEAIISLERNDRRTHEVTLEVGKLRYGSKPEPMSLWFDARQFRLTPLPPVIAVLYDGDHTRNELIKHCGHRFGVAERTVDEMIAKEKQFLTETQQGHRKAFGINLDTAVNAPWCKLLFGT